MTELLDSQQVMIKCAELAADKKGRDMKGICLQGLTLICDYFLIITAANSRQAQTICDHIHQEMKSLGQPPLRVEGYQEARWILVDLGAVVVHIFQEDERRYYDLERLWADGQTTDF